MQFKSVLMMMMPLLWLATVRCDTNEEPLVPIVEPKVSPSAGSPTAEKTDPLSGLLSSLTQNPAIAEALTHLKSMDWAQHLETLRSNPQFSQLFQEGSSDKLMQEFQKLQKDPQFKTIVEKASKWFDKDHWEQLFKEEL